MEAVAAAWWHSGRQSSGLKIEEAEDHYDLITSFKVLLNDAQSSAQQMFSDFGPWTARTTRWLWLHSAKEILNLLKTS